MLIAQQGGNLRHGRRCGLAKRAQGEHGLAANLRLLVLQLLGDRRNRVFGRGANVAEDDQGPVGGLVVLQGLDQAGHGLDAAFRNGVQNPPADGRIGILQQLDADGESSLSGRGEWPRWPATAVRRTRLVGVFQQLGQGRHGILGGGADRPQGQRRMGADLGRFVFEQVFDRLDGLGRLFAAARQLVERLRALSASLSDFKSLASFDVFAAPRPASRRRKVSNQPRARQPQAVRIKIIYLVFMRKLPSLIFAVRGWSEWWRKAGSAGTCGRPRNPAAGSS